MSENTRKKVKITIEVPDGTTSVIECHGIAATTLTDDGDKYDCGALIVGNLCVKELLTLHENVGEELLHALEQQILSHADPRDVLKAVFGILKGE